MIKIMKEKIIEMNKRNNSWLFGEIKMDSFDYDKKINIKEEIRLPFKVFKIIFH